jgi:hypothetical protein
MRARSGRQNTDHPSQPASRGPASKDSPLLCHQTVTLAPLTPWRIVLKLAPAFSSLTESGPLALCGRAAPPRKADNRPVWFLTQLDSRRAFPNTAPTPVTRPRQRRRRHPTIPPFHHSTIPAPTSLQSKIESQKSKILPPLPSFHPPLSHPDTPPPFPHP